jgi:hypothetical protein
VERIVTTGLGGHCYGYDPARILVLGRRTDEAIDGLHQLRCDDPAAAEALRVVRLTRHNLEHVLKPLVQSIASSRAMSVWSNALGPSTDDVVRAVGGLVAHLGATAGWVALTGLEGLTDDEILVRWDDAPRRLSAALADGHDVDDAARGLVALLTETAARAHDPHLVDRWWRSIGPEGLADLLEVADRAHDAIERGLAEVGGPVDAVDAPLALLLALASRRIDGVTAGLVDAARRSDLVTDLVLIDPVAFPADTLGRIGAALVRHVAGDGDRPSHLADLDHEANAVLGAVAVSPAASLTLLADGRALAGLATSSRLDGEVVEHVLAAGIAGAPSRSDEAALAALAALVDVAGHDELTTGARRGAARAFGAHLPVVAPQLDRRRRVVVVDTASSATVDLGSYDDVARLVGQVVGDAPAQMTLGVLIGAFRTEQLDLATSALADASGFSPAEARDVVAGHLADVTRVLELVDAARHANDELLALRHGIGQARSQDVLFVLSTAMSWWAPASAVVTRRAAAVATRVVGAVVGSSSPTTTPRTGVEADLAAHHVVGVLALPTRDEDARRALGLEAVSASTWDAVGSLLDAFEAATDADERTAVLARLTALATADPRLDAYVEQLAAGSGDSGLG